MKSTKAFMCTARTFMWEDGDWDENGHFVVDLAPGTQIVGFQTFCWNGSLRKPVNWPAYIKDDKFTLECDDEVDFTEEGCVTLYLRGM